MHSGLPDMTSAQKGVGGQEMRINSTNFADEEGRQWSKSSKITWTSYMETSIPDGRGKEGRGTTCRSGWRW